MSEWDKFQQWLNRFCCGAANGFVHIAERVTWTTEQVLNRYPPAKKDERLRGQLLERAKRETCGIHAVNRLYSV